MADTGADIQQTNGGTIRIEYDKGRLIVNDGNLDILLLGRGPDGKVTARLAQPGFDVKYATQDQLQWSTEKRVLEVIEVLQTPFTLSSGNLTASTTVDARHSQGVAPLSIAAIQVDTLTNGTTGLYQMPFFVPGVGGGTTNVFVMLSYARVKNVNGTRITYEVGIQGGSQTFNGTILTYILKQPIATPN